MRPKAQWAIYSEAMRAIRNNCFSKIQLVGQKYRDKTTLASFAAKKVALFATSGLLHIA